MLKDCMPKAYSGKEPYVFFSYSHKNQKSIINFVEQMSRKACRIWYDEGIESGYNWDDYISEKIEGSSLFISFISSTYLESPICKNELRYAEKKGKNILIVFLDDARLTGGLELRFDCYQSIFYKNYSNDSAFLEEIMKSNYISNCFGQAISPVESLASPVSVTEIIENDINNKAFVYKYPSEDFKPDSQLIVAETQEAIIFKEGVAFGPYTQGKHMAVPADGNALHYQIYFMNMVEQQGILWGLSPKLKYLDPVCNAQFDLGASGNCSYKIIDSKLLLTKLIGADTQFEDLHLGKLFRMIGYSMMTDALLKTIQTKGISILQLDVNKPLIAAEVKEMINPVFKEYGLEITNFAINTFVYPEDNVAYQALLKDTNNSAEILGIRADKKKENIDAVLSAETEEDVLDTKELRAAMRAKALAELDSKICKNCGARNAVNAKFCLECGTPLVLKCSKCGAMLPENAKFCLECGEKV